MNRDAAQVDDQTLAHLTIADVLDDVAEVRAVDALIGVDRRHAYDRVYSAFRAFVRVGAVVVEPIGEGARPEARTYTLAPGFELPGS